MDEQIIQFYVKGKKMILRVKRSMVERLFEALGFKTVKRWDDKKLLAKTDEISDLTEGVKIRIPKLKKLVKSMLDADEIVFEHQSDASQDSSTKEEANKKKVIKKKKVSKKKEAEEKEAEEKEAEKKVSKKKVSKKKDESGVDRFGRRLGTQGAAIDTALEKKPKSVEAIAKETKLPVGRIAVHLKDLLGKNFIKQDDKGNYFVK